MNTSVDNNDGFVKLGKHIHRLREAQGLRLREAARKAGVDPTWLSRLEQGVYTSPDQRSLVKVARGLGADGSSVDGPGKHARASHQDALRRKT